MLEILFCGSILTIFYAYFGYPISLFLAGIFRKKEVKKEPISPYVTVIIPAYKAEKVIRKKIENTLGLEYPKEKIQIIVTSDGSTDRTNEITRGYQEEGVELLQIPEHKGKENAQKEAMRQARGDIIVFSDTATLLDPEALSEIISNFSDPSVGCVSSEDRLVGRDGKPCGEGFYVGYETWLRRLESRVNSLVGLSGSFFAARREVCQDFSGDMQSDFRTVLNAVKIGLRGVSDPGAIGYYPDITEGKREFDRKVRTVLRGLTVFFHHLEFLNFFRYGLFSYQFFCHKLLRWLVPFFLILCFASNVFLVRGSLFYKILLLIQFSFYGLAAWTQKNEAGGPARAIVTAASYFLVVNLSILIAWWRYLRGQRIVMWQPSER